MESVQTDLEVVSWLTGRFESPYFGSVCRFVSKVSFDTREASKDREKK